MNYIAVNDAEHATILAALRYYQENGQGNPDNRSKAIHEIATNCDTVMSSLDDDGIDALCERINIKQHAALLGPMIEIPEPDWELTGSGSGRTTGEALEDDEDPSSRLLASIVINGTPMHLEAIAVDEDKDEQVAADASFEDDLESYQNIQDTSFQTTTIKGREYVLVATPHGS